MQALLAFDAAVFSAADSSARAGAVSGPGGVTGVGAGADDGVGTDPVPGDDGEDGGPEDGATVDAAVGVGIGGIGAPDGFGPGLIAGAAIPINAASATTC